MAPLNLLYDGLSCTCYGVFIPMSESSLVMWKMLLHLVM